MIAFVMVALGRCCSGPVLRRSWLGLGGVMLVVAAGLAAYGVNSGFGEATHLGALEGGGRGGVDLWACAFACGAFLRVLAARLGQIKSCA